MAAVAVLACGALGAATDRLFVHPRVDRPAPANAVVVLGGGDTRARRLTGERLAAGGYAPVVVFSVPDRAPCPPAPAAGVTVRCFVPRPYSTRGEARYVAGLARAQGWNRVIVVSGHAQTTRARLRVRRCWDGEVRMVPSPPAANPLTRAYRVVYEWGALLKAELWQRGC